jgi:hypothetical protein
MAPRKVSALVALIRRFMFRRDYLTGTEAYGTYVANATSGTTFSIEFSALVKSDTDIMFMSGDRSRFLVTKHATVVKTRGSALPLPASLSSTSLCIRILFVSGLSYCCSGCYYLAESRISSRSFDYDE